MSHPNLTLSLRLSLRPSLLLTPHPSPRSILELKPEPGLIEAGPLGRPLSKHVHVLPYTTRTALHHCHAQRVDETHNLAPPQN